MPEPGADQAGLVLIDLRGSNRPAADAASGPLAVVCGLPMLVRNLLLLQRAGFSTALLLCEPADRERLKQVLEEQTRLQLRIDLVTGERELFPAGAQPPTRLLYWPGALSFGRRLPRLATAALDPGVAALLPVSPDGHPAVGPILLAADRLAPRSAAGLDRLLQRLPGDEHAARFPLDDRPRPLLDAAAVREAERALLRSLRKEVDGVVARFDRYVSLAVSRRLMRLPVTPNQVTVAAGLLGIGCGLLASLGGYWPMLLAALGFQLNSILDGIDGEIARAKLLESRLGQWLDTLADDTSNLCFSVGVGVGCYRTWGQEIYLGLAAVAGCGFVITAALMYRYIITVAHSGDLNDFKMPWEEQGAGAPSRTASPTGMAAVLARLKFVVRRDTFVFLSTCFALVGELRVMAWLFAAGATAVWLSILAYRVLRPALQGHPQ